MEARFCPSCGQEVESDDRFCRACGREFTDTAATGDQRESLSTSSPAEDGASTSSEAKRRAFSRLLAPVIGVVLFLPRKGHAAFRWVRARGWKARVGIALAAILLAGASVVAILVATDDNVPDTVEADHLNEDRDFWEELAADQRDDLSGFCADRAGGRSEDPEIVFARSELRTGIDRELEDDSDATIKAACDDAAADIAAENEPSGTGETQTNATWGVVWNSGGELNDGDPVKLAGRVYQDTGTSLLMYADPVADELPTQVFGSFSGIQEDDYVLVRGTITGSDSYETVAGGSIDVITIDADSVKQISAGRAQELARPATGGSEKLNITQSQGGFAVTVRKIGWTEDATRVSFSVTNKSGAEGSLFVSDAKIQQGSQQFSVSDDADYGPLGDDILSGASVTGSLEFDKIDRKRGKAYIEVDWYSENYDIDAKPFGFTVSWAP